ncbi:MAG: selenium-dependent xanthine dehydrogenase, partial [Chloroflexi bacterium]
MEFKLNGRSILYDGNLDLDLLTYLREEANILSPKNGCSPQAACGACTVDLNGKTVLSCVTKMSKVADGTVTTIEGMGQYRQDVFANAFVEKGGVQCGFCIPGIVVQANSLINRNPEPTWDDVEKALTPNLCRCTGYKKVIDSILYAADAIWREEEIPPPTSDGKVGSRHPKYDAQKLVLGQHEYTDDIRIEGMVHGALRFSDHPRAKVLSIDSSEAEKMDGVIRVFTADDVPGERTIGLIREDWPLMIAVGETTRYVGDVLASVVAEKETQARAAAAAIKIEYKVYEPLTDMHAAMQPDAPKIHEAGNILSKSITSRGAVTEGEA